MNSRIWLFLISTVVAACSITSHSTTPTERGRHISGDALLARAVEAGPVTLTQVVAASSFTLAGKGDFGIVSFTSLAWRSSRTLWLKPVPTCPI